MERAGRKGDVSTRITLGTPYVLNTSYSRGRAQHIIRRLTGNDITSPVPRQSYRLLPVPGIRAAHALRLLRATRGNMKGSGSQSPSASVATTTTTDVQGTPTALLQLDREQASGFWGHRFGSRVVRTRVRRRVWGERPGTQARLRRRGRSGARGRPLKRTPAGSLFSHLFMARLPPVESGLLRSVLQHCRSAVGAQCFYF